MIKINLKKALDLLGYNVVQYGYGYNYRSGFMRKKDSNELFYFSFEDLRDKYPTLLVRTADETKVDRKGKFNDWKGGINTYPLGNFGSKENTFTFEGKTYQIHEERKQKYDYNS